MKRIECIAIGDELLDGRTAETNSSWLGSLLFDQGTSLSRVTIVGDDLHDIVGALEEARGQVVVVCGGLGPTADDMTRDAAAAWQKTQLVVDDVSRKRLEDRFAERGYTLTTNNYRQAMFPRTARVLATEVGSAAGFAIETDTRTFMFFPGVPKEFRWFVETYLVPLIELRPARRCQLYFFGRGESALEDDLRGLDALAAHHGVRVGYRVCYPEIEVKLSGTSDDVEHVRTFVLERVGAYNIGEDNESLAARVGRLLKQQSATVTTAESCTAGAIAAAITDIAGSSAWFERGFITYSNQAKIDLVGVSAETLKASGAVSAETVCQMAYGAREAAHATYALAVSGIAGPGGGTAEKPVGTIHFGVATPHGVWHMEAHFAFRTRDEVRVSTVYTALAILLSLLEGKTSRFTLHGPYAPSDFAAGKVLDV